MSLSPDVSRPAADPNELLLLRSIFKGLPNNPEPLVISSALGRYASYLSQTKDARASLAEEFFQSSLAVAAESPCPRAVHTYHWFLCVHKKNFSSLTQYENLRARAPVRIEDHSASLTDLGQPSGVQHFDILACRANFLDELCLRRTEAASLWEDAMRCADESGEQVPPFTRAKYAAFLLRYVPARAEEAREIFADALRKEPENIEGMVDFALLLAARGGMLGEAGAPLMLAQANDWFRKALHVAPDDARVLSMYAVFLAGEHKFRDVEEAEKLHCRAVTNARLCAGALGRYAEFLETERSDVEGAGELFRRCHEADARNLVGLLGLAAMKHRAGDSETGERLYRQAVQTHPDDANALGALGSFLLHVRQKREEAGDLLRRAVTRDAGHANNLANLALFLSEGTGAECEEAGGYYKRATSQNLVGIRDLGRLAVYQERFIKDHLAAEDTYCRAIQHAHELAAAATKAGGGGGGGRGQGERGHQGNAGQDPYLAMLLANYSTLVANRKLDAAKAGELLRQAVEVDPTNALVLWMQADYMEHVTKDFGAADQRYRRACQLASDNPDILGAFAAFLAGTMGDLDQAEDYYCRAIELDRRHAENLGGYAVLLMTLAQRDGRAGGDVAPLIQRAHDCFRVACEEAPGNAAHTANYAVFLANVACETAEARQLFESALEAEPVNIELLLNYAHFLEMCLEDDEAAEGVFQRALATSQRQDARVLGSYAVFRARVHEDSLDENKLLFQEAIRADERNASNMAAFAQYLSRVLAEQTEADAYFQKAIRQAPKDADILGSYAAFVAEVQHDNDAAEVYYKRAIEADPDNATNLGKFAYFLHAVRGDVHMAHMHYQRAVQCGNNADILGNYATFLETERDDRENAEYYYKQAIAVDPRHAFNLTSYARLLAYTNRDNETAEALFRRAVKADLGEIESYIDFLSSVRETDQRAHEYYLTAIKEFPQCAPLLQSYGEYLDQVLGDPAEAARYYKLASEIVTL
jgi:Tfp pilus assembly protein PilF